MQENYDASKNLKRDERKKKLNTTNHISLRVGVQAVFMTCFIIRFFFIILLKNEFLDILENNDTMNQNIKKFLA